MLKSLPAQELGRIAAREAIERTGIAPSLIDHVVIGNVGSPADATNIARVIAVKAGVPARVPGATPSIATAPRASRRSRPRRGSWASGEAKVVLAGGVESMSQIPLLFGDEAKGIFVNLARAKTLGERAAVATRFRPRHLAPVVALEVGLTDPISGLNMGETAEVLAKEWKISREAQDEFALRSHQRAVRRARAGSPRRSSRSTCRPTSRRW